MRQIQKFLRINRVIVPVKPGYWLATRANHHATSVFVFYFRTVFIKFICFYPPADPRPMPPVPVKPGYWLATRANHHATSVQIPQSGPITGISVHFFSGTGFFFYFRTGFIKFICFYLLVKFIRFYLPVYQFLSLSFIIIYNYPLLSLKFIIL